MIGEYTIEIEVGINKSEERFIRTGQNIMIDIRRKPSTYGYGEVLNGRSRKVNIGIKKKEYHEFQRLIYKRSIKEK